MLLRTKKATAVGIYSGALAAKRIVGVLIPVCFLLADRSIVPELKAHEIVLSIRCLIRLIGRSFLFAPTSLYIYPQITVESD